MCELNTLIAVLLDAGERSGLSTSAVLVVNDDSDASGVQGAHVVQGHGNIGYSAGVSVGVREIVSDYVCIVNPDCIADLTEFVKLFKSMQARDGITVPILLNDHGVADYVTYEDWVFTPGRKIAERRCKNFLLNSEESVLPAFVKVPGTFLCMPTSIAHALGGPFDASFFLYGEDRDLTYRARRLNVGLYLDRGVRIGHVGGVSGVTVSSLVSRSQVDGAIRIAFRRYGPFGAYACIADTMCVAILKSILRRDRQLDPAWWGTRRWFGAWYRERSPLTEDIVVSG
jgi:GT2 family glycosyltransferase